jgi:uncharacterized protein (UPF0276 family)
VLWAKKEWYGCRLMTPFDREVENKALELYQEIIAALQKDYSTSVEEDEELEEEQKLHYEERTAIIFRV